MNLCEKIGNNSFWLLADRCMYWEEANALVVSDLHFGKTGHFRKAGIALPQNLYRNDLMRLFNAIQQYRASQVIIVGDLFHSKENRELDLFSRWRQDISGVDLLLIKGNHDILPRKWYETSDIQVFDQHHTLNGICFTHDMNTASCEADGNVHYYISGHIHPGISISGPARQQLQFPCFHFTPQYAVLPAFSHFTGLYMIRPAAGDKTYAIVNKSIIAV